MTIVERVADLARELPVEAQREVLDFVEFVRARALGQADTGAADRGTLGDLRAALRTRRDEPESGEPEWSPFEIEPMGVGYGEVVQP